MKLPEWNDEPLTDEEMDYLRRLVRLLVEEGKPNIAAIISHAENELVSLRAQVTTLRQDRDDAWARNAQLDEEVSSPT